VSRFKVWEPQPPEKTAYLKLNQYENMIDVTVVDEYGIELHCTNICHLLPIGKLYIAPSPLGLLFHSDYGVQVNTRGIKVE